MNDSLSPAATDTAPVQISVAVSARHVHLTQATVDRLFGAGHELKVRTPLLQPDQYAAAETVTLIGPQGRLPNVRVVGPTRNEDQVELSRSDQILLGIDAPLRESGDLAATPGIAIEGPVGRVTLDHGVIGALRHIHMSPAVADVLGLKDHDRVDVAVNRENRRLTFGDVIVRVSPAYRLELHLDTDEGNAAGLPACEVALLLGRVVRSDASGRATGC
jgi:acetate kinase